MDGPPALPAPAGRRARWLQERRRGAVQSSGDDGHPPGDSDGPVELGGSRLTEVQPPAFARMEELGGLESVAGNADHDCLVALDPPFFDELPQARHNDTAGRFTQDALRLG